MEKEAFSNLTPTIFAPGGRLFSVERAMEAVNRDHPSNNLVIAMKCKEGMVVVTSQVQSPYLSFPTDAMPDDDAEGVETAGQESSSFSSLLLPDTGVPRPPFSRLSTKLWGVTGGNAADAQLLRLQLQGVSDNLRFQEDSEDDSLAHPGMVARRLADRRQRATQQSINDDYGLLNATALIFHDDDLWRVDPTGQFYQLQAAVVGRKAHVAEAELIRRLSANIHDVENEDEEVQVAQDPELLQNCIMEMSQKDALKLAAECIRNTLSSKQKATPSSIPVTLKALCLYNQKVTWLEDGEL